jgi:hypothetical protein
MSDDREAIGPVGRRCMVCSVAFKSQNHFTRPNRGKYCTLKCYAASMLGVKTTIDERFWRYANPEPNTGCWLWSGAAGSLGYAQLWDGERTRRASHIALEMAGRPLPKGLFALHRCDTPACVNPDHLFAGDAKANMQDCLSKGRARGRLSKPKLECRA